ncbi:MAG: TonB-dependent receptor [Deltaproteobacteria bacterium]|nr:TonB-dependent receptor [Deltaproteobacteria bacterium]
MATARYGTQFNGDTYGRFYINRHDQDSYEFLEDKTDAYDDWDTTSGGFRLDGDVGLNDSWTFQGDYYRNNENQRNDTYWVQTSLLPLEVEDSVDAEGFNLLARWTHKYSDSNSWTLQSYYDDYQREEIYIQQDHQILDIDFQHRLQPIPRHDVIWGLGYRLIKDKFGNTSQISFSPEKNTNKIVNAFVQDEIKLSTDQLLLTLGSKFERNDYTGTEIQPSVRLLWKPTGKHSLWTAVSQAVRTPSRAEDTGLITVGMIPYPPGIIVPAQVSRNNDLNAEKLLAYEAGYRFSADKNFVVDMALYYNSYENLITYQQTATGFQFYNGLEGDTYGFEINAEWKPTEWLTSELSYSYIHLNIDIAPTVDSSFAVVAEKSNPEHQFSVRSNIDLGHDLHLNLWGRYVDNVDAATSTALISNIEVDSYFELDSNIIWKPLEGLEFMLAGQNLLNRQHLEFVQEQFTSPIEIGRSVYAKLTWKF